MKNNGTAKNGAKKILKGIHKKSLGRQDFFNMYLFGKYIEFCLEGFEVIAVKDTTTRFSDCYLHIIKDKKEFILSEQVAQAFSACLRYVESCKEELGEKTADLLMSCVEAESVLNSFIDLYESIERVYTKEEVVDKLSLRVDKFLEDIHEAFDSKLQIKIYAIGEAVDGNEIAKAIEELDAPVLKNFIQCLLLLELETAVNC